MRRIARLLIGGVIAVATTFGYTAGATVAAAATLPIGACTTSVNAVVAVDFGHWGGPVVRACGSTPTTGFDLVNEGGFHTVGTQHDGPAFICRISSSSFGDVAYPLPSESGESCVLTPPKTGYWSYWHANPGQSSWTYSQTGATESRPEPGSVDLWTFGATTVPGFSPATVRADNTAPVVVGSTPTAPSASPTHGSNPAPAGTSRATVAPGSRSAPRTSPGTTPTTGPGNAPTGSSTGKTADHSSTNHSSINHSSTNRVSPINPTHPSTTTTTPAPAGAGPSSTATPTVIDAKTVASRPASPGSPWPVAIAVTVAVFLAGGAVLTVRRRRRNSPA